MKKTLLLGCLVALTSSAVAKQVVNIQHWQSKQGAQVYFVKATQLPMLDIEVVFTAGSAYDQQQYGLAGLTSSMLGEATKALTADQIAQAFDAVGAQFSANISRDMAMVHLRSLTDSVYLTPALKTLTAVLDSAIFPDKNFARVKKQTAAAIKLQQQSPGAIARNTMYHTLYESQPYGHAPMGTLSSIASMTATQAAAFYHQYYVVNNAKIILVGNITKDQASMIANQVVAGLPRGQAVKPLHQAHTRALDQQVRVPFQSAQTAINLSQLGISRRSPYYFPLMVGNHVFGGLPLSSILYQQIRNKRGLSYAVGSVFKTLFARGPFVIALKTRNSKATEAVSVIKAALHAYIKAGPTAAELSAAKQNLIGAFPLAVASNQNVLANVVTIAFYGLPLNYLDTYRDKVAAVTAAQIKNAFVQVVHPDQMNTVMVGPKQKKPTKSKG